MSKIVQPKKEKDFYVNTPWKSMDEYFQLVNHYGIAGKELARLLIKKRSRIPLPIIRPPKYWEENHIKRMNTQSVNKLKGLEDAE